MPISPIPLYVHDQLHLIENNHLIQNNARMDGAWNENGSHPGLATTRRPFGVLPPDGTHAVCRTSTIEVRPQRARERYQYLVWRHSSRGSARDTRRPYGGLPPEGMESCLQTVRMRHRSPVWRKSSRQGAPVPRRPRDIILYILLNCK